MSQDTCQTCHFRSANSTPVAGKPYYGCRRFPPPKGEMVDNLVVGKPVLNPADFWCGEFQRRVEAQPPVERKVDPKVETKKEPVAPPPPPPPPKPTPPPRPTPSPSPVKPTPSPPAPPRK